MPEDVADLLVNQVGKLALKRICSAAHIFMETFG